MNSLTISVPGKVFLAGEHAVVYGAKAVLAAVGLRCAVKVKSGTVDTITVNSKNYQDKKLIEFADQAKTLWQEFQQNGNFNPLKQWMSGKDSLIKIVLGESLIKGGKSGVVLKIESLIPMGAGMGSSAAVATALGTAVGLSGKELDEAVTVSERCQHGNPSGADQATVLNGGLVEYQKVDGQKMIKPAEFNHQLPEFILINSGKPAESTGEMVAMVAERFKADQEKLKTICSQISQISEQWLKGGNISQLIKQNEKYLEELGVVGEKAKMIVAEIERIGGSVKICGAGGVKAGAGTMLAYHGQPQRLKKLVKEKGWEYYTVELGVTGLSYEKN